MIYLTSLWFSGPPSELLAFRISIYLSFMFLLQQNLLIISMLLISFIVCVLLASSLSTKLYGLDQVT